MFCVFFSLFPILFFLSVIGFPHFVYFCLSPVCRFQPREKKKFLCCLFCLPSGFESCCSCSCQSVKLLSGLCACFSLGTCYYFLFFFFFTTLVFVCLYVLASQSVFAHGFTKRTSIFYLLLQIKMKFFCDTWVVWILFQPPWHSCVDTTS